MSLRGNDGFEKFQKEIGHVAAKFPGLDDLDKERRLFCTLTAIQERRTWRDRLRDWFFQLIFRCRCSNEYGRALWERRLFDWDRHLDAYFQIADEKKRKITDEKESDDETADKGTGDWIADEERPDANAAETVSTETIPSYSVTKHGTERLALLFDHLQILDGKFSMLLSINSVIVALVGLSLNETTGLFDQIRSFGTRGASWFQWLILVILAMTIVISFFDIWYAIRGFRRIVWGDLTATNNDDGRFDVAKGEREYALSLILSLARRTNVFRIVANSTRWAIGFFMTFAVLAGVMFVHTTSFSDATKEKCKASPHCCWTDSEKAHGGGAADAAGAPTASVTIGSLGLPGYQARDATPSETTLHLSAGVEDALTHYLKNGSSAAGENSLFSGGRGVALFLLLAAGAGLIAWAIRKRPAVAAPLSAAGLAAAVIKNPEYLSRLGRGSFVYVLILFSVVMVVLLFLSVREFLHHRTPRDEEGEESDGKQRMEKKSVESPLNIVFSLAVLLWAVIIACYHTEPAAAPPLPPPGPIATISKVPQVIPLGAISGFQPYSSKIEDLKTYSLTALKSDLRNNGAGPGDLLLLLGSADCTAIHANNMTNEQLAKNRAYTIDEMLSRSGVLMGEKVLADSLYQHERCRGSEDMRAVFPVLIHMEPGKP
jgi:uncharacterized membrane protein